MGMNRISETSLAAGPARALDTSYVGFVDGLRAVSILAVVAYHVGLIFVPGGFVGVDIFFVISGFLIIGQITTGLDTGNFSFAEFWSRRALRIVPPYILVIVVSSALASYVLVTPAEFGDFGQEVLYSAGMVVNLLFLNQSGYFDIAAESKPLLHLWSLAVEEQFYFIAPILLFAVWAALRRLSRPVATRIASALAIATAVVSFALCVRYTDPDRNYAFYLMPLRAWEFVLGGMVPSMATALRARPSLARQVCAIVGIGMIGYAVFLFGPSQPFPSYWAAVPALGATLVIAAGVAGQTSVSRLLALAPMRWLGLVSYAWYLWHWPLLSLTRILNFGVDRLGYNGAAALVALVLAIATHLLVERPLRARRRTLTQDRGWRVALAGLAACAVLAGAGWVGSALLPSIVRASIPPGLRPGTERPPNECSLEKIDRLEACAAAREGRPLVVLIGDSHAAAIARVLAKTTGSAGRGLVTIALPSCPPLLETVITSWTEAHQDDCLAKQRRSLKLLGAESANVVAAVLESQWEFHPDGLAHPDDRTASDDQQAFVAGVSRTLKTLRSIGVRRILVVAPIPVLNQPAPDCLVRSRKYNISPDINCSRLTPEVVAERAHAMTFLRAALEGQDDVQMYDPLGTFCKGNYCRPYQGTKALYSDHSHLSAAGVELLLSEGQPAFEWTIGASFGGVE